MTPAIAALIDEGLILPEQGDLWLGFALTQNYGKFSSQWLEWNCLVLNILWEKYVQNE